MDNSISIEGHQSLRSPPRRRRSTFFEKRGSLIPEYQTENIDESNCQKSEQSDNHMAYLTGYYGQLLEEKTQWKTEVKERRNRYKDLQKQYEINKATPSSRRMSYSTLTNEDIEFLKAKPNVSKFIDSQQKLHKSVNEIKALSKRVNALDDVLLSFCEDKVNEVTEYILENSTVEFVSSTQ